MSLFIQFCEFDWTDMVIPALHAGCFRKTLDEIFDHILHTPEHNTCELVMYQLTLNNNGVLNFRMSELV
jgi:hypothetical protein